VAVLIEFARQAVEQIDNDLNHIASLCIPTPLSSSKLHYNIHGPGVLARYK